MDRQKEQCEEAKELVKFYTNLMENNSTTASYYLAENVVLDWFGKSIKDKKKVCTFIKEQVSKVTHFINSTVPVDNVAFKECHKIKPSNKRSLTLTSINGDGTDIDSTPIRSLEPSTSHEIGQGDGLHNCFLSPSKKIKLCKDEEHEKEEAELISNEETVESETETMKMKYLTAEGALEFRKPSLKKLQSETKWKRPAKLHLGYTCSSFKDFTIYLIIYEGNLKCRRNLLKEFCDSTTS